MAKPIAFFNSRFGGVPCALVRHEGKSENRKTGKVFTLSVIPIVSSGKARFAPSAGACVADCLMLLAGICYATWFRSLPALQASLHENLLDYTGMPDDEFRLTAIGDIAAMPHKLFAKIFKRINPSKVLGYTHGWETAPWLAPFCMASVHSLADAEKALSLGFQPFLSSADETAPLGFQECLASSKGLQCCACLGCARKRKAFWIRFHGACAKKALRLFAK